MTEMNTVKQAIFEGNLWDLVETRAKGHAEMASALKSLSKYSKYLEEGSPGFKGKGVFYYDYNSLAKPEVIRYQNKLLNNYAKPDNRDTHVLLTEPAQKPFNRSHDFKKAKKQTEKYNDKIHYCFIAAPYGLIPEYLAETYPASQYQMAVPLDHETVQHTVDNILEYLEKNPLKHTVIVYGDKQIDQELVERLGGKYPVIHCEDLGDDESTQLLIKWMETI